MFSQWPKTESMKHFERFFPPIVMKPTKSLSNNSSSNEWHCPVRVPSVPVYSFVFFSSPLLYLFVLVLLTRRTNNLKRFVLCTKISTSMAIRLCLMRANQGDRWFGASMPLAKFGIVQQTQKTPKTNIASKKKGMKRNRWMERWKHCDKMTTRTTTNWNRHLFYHCVDARVFLIVNVRRFHRLEHSFKIEIRQQQERTFSPHFSTWFCFSSCIDREYCKSVISIQWRQPPANSISWQH